VAGEWRVVSQRYEAEVPLERLSEWPGNPNDGADGVLGESLDEHGFFGAVYAQQSTGRMIGGNHRLQQAHKRGAAWLPVIWLDVDDDTAARMLLVDNEATRRGANDPAKLLAMLQGLTSLRGTGFDAKRLEYLARAQAWANAERGDKLALAAVAIAEPRHEVELDQVWGMGDHKLAVCDLLTGWPVWAPLLTAGCVFLPYPTPMAPHAPVGRALVMVQPHKFLAGVTLDKWQDLTGQAPVLIRAVAQ
jgi:hypothetical protein